MRTWLSEIVRHTRQGQGCSRSNRATDAWAHVAGDWRRLPARLAVGQIQIRTQPAPHASTPIAGDWACTTGMARSATGRASTAAWTASTTSSSWGMGAGAPPSSRARPPRDLGAVKEPGSAEHGRSPPARWDWFFPGRRTAGARTGRTRDASGVGGRTGKMSLRYGAFALTNGRVSP